MAETATPQTLSRGPDWRLRISFGITIGWLVLGFLYISSVVGWADFITQNAPALGSFLEGAFAPLAFLWLVVGFFLQQQQLEQNTQTIEKQLVVMHRQAELTEIQSRAIAADELHSRQDTFLRITEMVYDQLGVIAGYVVTSWVVGEAEESMTAEDGPIELWKRHGEGDKFAFGRKMSEFFYRGAVTPAELFWGTEVRARHTDQFMFHFERLVRLARACDPEGIISDAISDGSHGRAYKFMLESRSDGQFGGSRA